MAILGYARVSTDSQNVDAQVVQLEDEGCERIFTETASGIALERPQLHELLNYARRGDVIVVTAADRLSRSLIHLLGLLEDFGRRGLEFRSLREHWDTTDPQGRLMLTIAGAFAQFERDLIAARTRAGLQAARDRGTVLGRPLVLTDDTLRALAALDQQHYTNSQIAAALKISESSVKRGLAILRRPLAPPGAATDH